MSKKEKAIGKAKESGKKIVEGGKDFGEELKWITKSLRYTLLGEWEKTAGNIVKSKLSKEGITQEEKRKYKDIAKKHAKNARKYDDIALEFTDKAKEGKKSALKGGAKAIGHTVKGGYHIIDYVDKSIGEKIEQKQIEKGKKSGKIGKFFRDNITKLVLALSLTGYGGYKANELANDKQENRQEIVHKESVKKSPAKDTKASGEFTLNQKERKYFQNPEFFDKDFKLERDETYKDKGVILIRDAGMTFYIVQDGENSKEKIREKLSTIPEFSYLKDSLYSNKIMGFNVPDSSLKKGLYIPIPINAVDRHVDIAEFKQYSKMALDEMKNDSHYGKDVQELINRCGEENIINVMVAYARCETATDQEKFRDPIGTAELHRWEPKYKSFSFSYYHILMEKCADGKTPGPGLKARQNLGLTEGQCYHPKNAGKLFLGYCFEKAKEKKKDLTYFFDINNLEQAKQVGGSYNGDSIYGKKLWDNIQYIKKNG